MLVCVSQLFLACWWVGDALLFYGGIPFLYSVPDDILGELPHSQVMLLYHFSIGMICYNKTDLK